MENKKLTAYVILLLFLVFGIIGIAAMARSVSGKRGKQEVQSKINSKIELLSRRDIDIYWIGDLPKALDKLNVKKVPAQDISESNMPVEFPTGGSGSGSKTYTMIVVYRSELSDADMDVIRDCTVMNRVPILIIGKAPIEKFREYMLKAPISYDEGSSFSYDVTDGMKDEVLDRSAVSTGGNLEGDAIVSYIVNYFGFTDDGTETEPTTEEEVTYTTLPAIDDDELELKKRVNMYREKDDSGSNGSAEVSGN